MSVWKNLQALFVVTFVLGCTSREMPPHPLTRPLVGTLACRIVASGAYDAALVAAARAESSRVVSQAGKTVGEWVPVADPSLAASDIDALPDAVLRQTESGAEILVVFSEGDVTDADVAAVHSGGFDLNGQPIITLTLTDEGSKKFFDFSVENASRHVAIIVGDAVQSVPQIQTPISDQFVIVSPTQAASDKLVLALTSPPTTTESSDALE
ncbi:hypothetical protein LOC71_07210 [Rhodopirellula sp. JC740]|uniref:SecDF P1 head subdomain domain-containing protein n=1 Tax=Rhodopirellula halodulae TaxID=2894198 RepID=A0ABS8NGV0_9BACT|nr:hypothetical protein [Rhodopirellula sp. JC740]MCC9642058.1 hypothetical protein [Rhodopirellula sp. JC740]